MDVTESACPTCGSPVRVVSADEGTSHYEGLPRAGHIRLDALRTTAMRWRGHVLVTAPGDFPERLSRDFDVEASSIEAAIEALTAEANQVGLDPVVTRVERTRPDWRGAA